jgi:hypothetical protein
LSKGPARPAFVNCAGSADGEEMNRKEMIRAYRQQRRPMGVYRVSNKLTGHATVAATKDLTARLNRHRAQLSTGGHPSRLLQADWNEHGPDSFTFEVLDTLDPPDLPDYDPLEDLTVLEDIWLEKLSLAADPLHTIKPGRSR